MFLFWKQKTKLFKYAWWIKTCIKKQWKYLSKKKKQWKFPLVLSDFHHEVKQCVFTMAVVAAPKMAMSDKTDTCPMYVAMASNTNTPYT